MRFGAFSNINWDETYKVTKKLLGSYVQKEMIVIRANILVKSPIITSMPIVNGNGNSVESHLTTGIQDAEAAQYECTLIANTIEALRGIDERHDIYANLLKYRYINGMKVIDVRKRLASDCDYEFEFPERTYNDLLHDAIWSFAIIYPKEDVRIKVSSK